MKKVAQYTTDGQLDVFNCPLHGKTLVEASAGCGKTWAISVLALRMLVEEGVTIDKLLVLTFTRAATAELKSRIREQLVRVQAALLREYVAQENGGAIEPQSEPLIDGLLQRWRASDAWDIKCALQRLQAALSLFDEAAIFTIHSFCQRALSDTPFTAAQPFGMEVQADDALIRRTVSIDFWRREVINESPMFIAWLSAGGRKSFTPTLLSEFLKRHLHKPLAKVLWPESSVDEERARAIYFSLQEAWEKAEHVWNTSGGDDISNALLRSRNSLRANVKLDEERLAKARVAWSTYFARRQVELPLPRDDAKIFYAGHFKPKKKCSPPSHPFFDAAKTLQESYAEFILLVRAWKFELIRRFLPWAKQELLRQKLQARFISYQDLLQRLYDALHSAGGERLAATLAARYSVALVDEFQDTDPLQFALLHRIYSSPHKAFFMVGDPKQAIYSFREADLHTYMKAKRQAQYRYTLTTNQRSEEGLIEAVNHLFSVNGRAFMQDGLDYASTSMGSKPRQQLHDQSETASLTCWRLPCSDDGKEMLQSEGEALAARASASEIARLLVAAEKGAIRIGERPLSPADIAVLVRTHAEANIMREALANAGIAAAQLSNQSVLASREAAELLFILHALANGTRRDLLRAALTTSLLGYEAASILELENDGAALEKLLRQWHNWRRICRENGIYAALSRLADESDLPARMLSLAMGERRLTNWRHLCELLHRQESLSGRHGGLQRLIDWMHTAQLDESEEGREEAQIRLESEERLVQIVTIHSAKGLEFAVVFCPFLWKPAKMRLRAAECLQYHDREGNTVLDYNTVDENGAAIAAAALERSAEQLRLIYVALTRAIHRCYLVYGASKAGNNTLLNWLVAGESCEPHSWPDLKIDREQVENAWQALAEKCNAQTLQCVALPTADSPPPATAQIAGALQARTRQAKDYYTWRMASFSSLMQASSTPANLRRDVLLAGDHFADNTVAGAESELGSTSANLLSFPPGVWAGDCIHHLFEQVNFQQPSGWPQSIAAALRTVPPSSLQDLPASQVLEVQLTVMLQQTLSVILPSPGAPGAFCLGGIEPGQRVAEWAFSLHAPQLDTALLGALMHEHGLVIQPLASRRAIVWLRGFVDLVCEADGRYYLIDWKSNYLGNVLSDYAPPALEEAMIEHGYHLQALLYALALHLHLKQRLADYDPQQHLGGCLYLFVRGIKPGASSGIYHWCPSPKLLAALEDMLGSG